jgi:Ca2+-transporting ATPase
MNAFSYGINKLPEARFKSLIELIWLALHDRTLIMLMIAACISLAIGISTEGGLYPSRSRLMHARSFHLVLLYVCLYADSSCSGPELGWKDGVAVLVAVMVVVAIDRYDNVMM